MVGTNTVKVLKEPFISSFQLGVRHTQVSELKGQEYDKKATRPNNTYTQTDTATRLALRESSR